MRRYLQTDSFEWSRMRLSRRSIGSLLPVFDCCYAVIAAPNDNLPATPLQHRLHAEAVNSLVTGLWYWWQYQNYQKWEWCCRRSSNPRQLGEDSWWLLCL